MGILWGHEKEKIYSEDKYKLFVYLYEYDNSHCLIVK